MTQKWICDKCGKEFDKEFLDDGHRVLWELRYNQWTVPIAEVCDDCRVKLDAVINEFFGKKVVEMKEEA
jgi:hypothetical protein